MQVILIWPLYGTASCRTCCIHKGWCVMLALTNQIILSKISCSRRWPLFYSLYDSALKSFTVLALRACIICKPWSIPHHTLLSWQTLISLGLQTKVMFLTSNSSPHHTYFNQPNPKKRMWIGQHMANNASLSPSPPSSGPQWFLPSWTRQGNQSSQTHSKPLVINS